MSVFQQMFHNYQAVLALLNILAAAFIITVVGCLVHAWRVLQRLNALEHRQRQTESEAHYE